MNSWTIEPGTIRDYHAFEDLHYRGRRPVAIDQVLLATSAEGVAGVLVVTRPVLNTAWRHAAWPGPQWADRRAAAAFVNEHVRRIARVVVDPRMRGLGVACSLVRAYLSAPRTSHTEAVASMGHISPFFERAGMRAVRAPLPKRHTLLAEQLASHAIEPWELMDAKVMASTLATNPALREAFCSWCRASRHSRVAASTTGGLLRESIYAASQVAWPAKVFVSP